jgi:hypothetical protein
MRIEGGAFSALVIDWARPGDVAALAFGLAALTAREAASDGSS